MSIVQQHQSLIRTASNTTRDSEIPVDNSVMTLQRMAYEEEINIKKDVTNVNPIPTRTPIVTTPQKNEKLTPNSNLENDVDDSLKKIETISDVSSRIDNKENCSEEKTQSTDVRSVKHVSEEQNSDFDVTIDTYVSKHQQHQSLMRTASDTTRDSQIPVNNSIMTLQRMTYEEEKNSEFDVSNINTIPTRNPNVPIPQKIKI